METQKYTIADLKGMTIQVVRKSRSKFMDIDNIRFSEIPFRDIDIIVGNNSVALTNDEFLNLIFNGETLGMLNGETYALFILDEPKKH